MLDGVVVSVGAFHRNLLNAFPILVFNDLPFIGYVLGPFHRLIFYDRLLIGHVFHPAFTYITDL